jgi:hypothetical protein
MKPTTKAKEKGEVKLYSHDFSKIALLPKFKPSGH